MEKLNYSVLYDEKTIRERVAALGKQISATYTDGKPVVCVCVLRGAVMFFADLMKELTCDGVVYDFVTLASYESALIPGSMNSTGRVRLIQDLRESVEDKHVLVVEDIVDSGYTIQYLRAYFAGKNAADVKIAALLDKPMTRKVDAQADYVAFTLERPAFIVGYGLDCNQLYRNLPGIYEVV